MKRTILVEYQMPKISAHKKHRVKIFRKGQTKHFFRDALLLHIPKRKNQTIQKKFFWICLPHLQGGYQEKC